MLVSSPTGALPGARVDSISVLLAENLDLMRCALTRLLGADFEVLGAQRCDTALVSAVLCLRPDVVIVDIDQPAEQCLAIIDRKSVV